MIEELLRLRFPSDYGLDIEKVNVPLSTQSESFTLSDQKACSECKADRPEREKCDEKTLKIKLATDETVTIVNFEKYLNQFGNRLEKYGTKRCDFLILDDNESHRKVAFCDLTCSDHRYVDGQTGKRAKVVKQMKDSLESLLKVDVLNQYILTFQDKVFLFGWREFLISDTEPERNNPLSNMGTFCQTPSAMSGTLEYQPYKGFVFIQVKYPAEYQW